MYIVCKYEAQIHLSLSTLKGANWAYLVLGLWNYGRFGIWYQSLKSKLTRRLGAYVGLEMSAKLAILGYRGIDVNMLFG